MTRNNLPTCLGWLLGQSNKVNVLKPAYVVPISDSQEAYKDSFEANSEDSIAFHSASDDEAMARLQYAPQSVKQPSNGPDLTSPNADSFGSQSARRMKTTASPIRGEALDQSLPRCKREPDMDVIDLDDIDDIDDLDTDDFDPAELENDHNHDHDHDHTASTFGNFGTPVKLWNQACAERPEPRPRNDKKRKSEEISGGIEIQEIDEGVLSNSEDEHVSPHSQSDGVVQLSVEPMVLESEDEFFETKSFVSKRNNVRDPGTAIVKSTPLRSSGQAAPNSLPAPNSQAKRLKKESPRRHPTATNVLGSSPKKHNNATACPSKVGVSLPPRELSVSRPTITSPEQYSASGAIKCQTPLQTFASILNSGSRSLRSSHTPASSVPIVSSGNSHNHEEDGNKTSKLMDVLKSASDDTLDLLITVAKQSVAHLRAQRLAHRCEQPEVPAAIEAAFEAAKVRASKLMPALISNVKIMQNLFRERQGYQQELELLLALADPDDDDDEAMDRLSDTMRAMKQKLTDAEANVLEVLNELNLTENEIQVLMPTETTESIAARAVDDRILVGSTQSINQRAMSSTETNVHASPSIAQTQYHKSLDKDTALDRLRLPLEPASRPVAGRNETFDSQHWQDLPLPDEPEYFTDMGSPRATSPFPDLEPDFGDDDDDEDLVNAFNDFEQTTTSVGYHRESSKARRPLAETSDNIRRPHAPQSQKMKENQIQYPWSKDIMTALNKRFHLREFRHNQLEAINATLEGKDTFVLMPTGGGKSLCYQLPSIITRGRTKGVTIVISPLLSLMQDQVDHLMKLKIQAYMINGETSRDVKQHITTMLRGPTPEAFIQLLYVTPEMMSKNIAMVELFQQLHQRNSLARLVIDEAHCVSQWGHDFRPDYKVLGEIRKKFPGVPVMALTATATVNVQIDVIKNLSIRGCETFTQSFNRPNLIYTVRAKGKKSSKADKDPTIEDIAQTIKREHNQQSGIIYCLARKTCEDVARLLRTKGTKCTHYHAAMTAEERAAVQKDWQQGRYDIIVATIAFGMGIDKPDVRFVIHHSLPKSLEGYYQETGRAGRDGNLSQCYLYYGYGDSAQLVRQINDGDGSWDQKERQKNLLRSMIHYCENNTDCRRVQVLQYFNENFKREDCNQACDNCLSDAQFQLKDYTDHAKKIIKLVRQLHKKDFTMLHCIDIYRGGKNPKINEFGHDELDCYGAGSQLERGDVERLFYHLLTKGAINEYQKKNRSGFYNQYIRLGTRYERFERGDEKLEFQVRVSSAKKPRSKAKGKEKSKVSKPKTGRQSNPIDIDEDDDEESDGPNAQMPPPTLVSSPIAARERRKPSRRSSRPVVLSDGDKHSDDEGFEKAMQQSKRGSKKPPAPRQESKRKPSGFDLKDEIVHNFVVSMGDKLRQLVVQKGLRLVPVTDSILRQIATAMPEDDHEIRRLSKLSDEQWTTFGKPLTRDVKALRATYAEIFQGQSDDNHFDEQGLNDDDFMVHDSDVEEYGSFDEDSDDMQESATSSRYFDARSNDLGKDVPTFGRQKSQSSGFEAKLNIRGSRAGNVSSKGKAKVTNGGGNAITSKRYSRNGAGVAKKKRASAGSVTGRSKGGSSRGSKKGSNSTTREQTNSVFGMMPT